MICVGLCRLFSSVLSMVLLRSLHGYPTLMLHCRCSRKIDILTQGGKDTVRYCWRWICWMNGSHSYERHTHTHTNNSWLCERVGYRYAVWIYDLHAWTLQTHQLDIFRVLSWCIYATRQTTIIHNSRRVLRSVKRREHLCWMVINRSEFRVLPFEHAVSSAKIKLKSLAHKMGLFFSNSLQSCYTETYQHICTNVLKSTGVNIWKKGCVFCFCFSSVQGHLCKLCAVNYGDLHGKFPPYPKVCRAVVWIQWGLYGL